MDAPRDGAYTRGMRPEKMRVWGAAEALLEEIDSLLPLVRRGARHAADHLERSGESVLFNIAEGVGAFRPKVKIAAYEVAKKEASEVRAILRRLVQKRMLTTNQIARSYNLTGTIIGMLTRAIVALGPRE
jgi:four helix bundle protein